MPETSQLTLPVLPLRNGVVFPHMVVTLRIETAEGRLAVAAAGRSGGRLLLVPRVGGDYASVGTVAEIQHADEDGNVVVSGLARARVGAGSSDDDGALWVEAETYPEADIVDEELETLTDEYRAVVSAVLELRGVGGVAERILDMENPSRLADLSVYSPDLSLEQKVEVLETLDIRRRLGKLLDWMREVLADLELRRRVRDEATERIDKSQREYLLRQQLEAIKRELGDDTDVAGEYRARLADGDRTRDRTTRPDERAVARALVDPHLARHHVRGPVGRDHRRPARPRRGVGGARRRPHRAPRRQGTHRRAPGGEETPSRAQSLR